MAKKSTKNEPVMIKKPKIVFARFKIKGIEPLNMHRLGKKLLEEFSDRDKGKIVKKKKKRNHQEEFIDSLHVIDKKGKAVQYKALPKKLSKTMRFGFPASGLKKAMVSACRQFKGVAMTEVRGLFFVCGEYIPIEGLPEMDQFWRRIGGKGPGTGTPDIGIRARFNEWSSTVLIKYNADAITLDSIVNLLSTAGFSVGLGEDRPEKTGGTFGQFEVV